MRICGEYTCTGCGACIYVCKRQCIDFKKNSYGEIYAEVDKDNCINCQRCINICPQNQKVKGKYPIKAYAAWSKLRQIRNYAASGGIATEIYTKAIKNGDYIIGAKFNDDCSVALKMTNNISDIEEFKNSKYVFSNTENIYIEIEKCLKVGKKIVAIGLPCQIAAIKKLFSENDDLLLIDLVCHGTTPFNDLKEHIKKLEETKKQKINKISYGKFIAVMSAMFLIIGGGISLAASQNPDGLEWSILRLTGDTKTLGYEDKIHDSASQIQDKTSFLPDYSFKDNDTWKGTTVSGIVGGIVTVAVICGAGYLIRFSQRKRKSDDDEQD